jgi:glycosyltransferase involved in cell wall biosynthesis
MPETRYAPIVGGSPRTNTSPSVSVVIVCYNQARYLRDAIESVLAQAFRDWEIVLIDDGSTDETAAVASSYPEVRYLFQPNQGLAAARNAGIRESSGVYLVFLDADDRLCPNAIASSFNFFREHPGSGFVFGAYRNIFHDGSPAPTEPPAMSDDDPYRRLLEGNFIGMHGTIMYSRQVIEEAGGFDETLRACEDYELYLRIARRWSIHQHAGLVAEYRQHDTNMSRDSAFMLDSVLGVLRAERRRLPDSRHRRALRSGIAIWKDYYGSRLLDEWRRNKNASKLWQLLRRYPGGTLRWAANALLRRGSALRPSLPIGFGSLRRLAPFSRQFGLDRGQPVDRYYIEAFLAEHSDLVRGQVLEIGDDAYSRRFGGDRITQQHVLHVVPGFPGATIIADLADASHIPSSSFDCIILTQTLHYIFGLRAAVHTLARILKPGGTILATLPGISQVCRDQDDRESDCWRFTEASARRLFRDSFPSASVRVRAYGNVLTATAFLYGLPVTELSKGELDYMDPDYPVTVAVAVGEGSR